MLEPLADCWNRIHDRIHQACRRANRPASSVTLIGVTKTVEAARIQEAIDLGLTDLGENRVQEARAKQMALGSRLKALGKDDQGRGLEPRASSLQPVRWHLIGHLQRNKVKQALEIFDVMHSVDSLELVDELERRAPKDALGSKLRVQGKNPQPIAVFIQVNISGELTKFGCRPDEVIKLATAVARSSQVTLAGLMTMAPFADDPERSRPVFHRLRQLRDRVASALSLSTGGGSAFGGEPRALSLSMGMSQDFEVAIEEGADFIRIGTALFGARDVA